MVIAHRPPHADISVYDRFIPGPWSERFLGVDRIYFVVPLTDDSMPVPVQFTDPNSGDVLVALALHKSSERAIAWIERDMAERLLLHSATQVIA